MKNSSVWNKFIWVSIFAISMGFLETAVVVYLREIIYAGDFEFPLKVLSMDLAVTELLREVATVLMLVGIGVLAGSKPSEKLAWFMYAFAIWDIFYYVFLKALLDWPKTLLDWDVLFLIPVTWVGPVIAPVILAFLMILLAMLMVYFNQKLKKVFISWKEWMLLILGSIVAIISFTYDYSKYILDHYSFAEATNLSSRQGLMDLSIEYIPETFIWWVFWLGAGIISVGIGMFYWRNKTLERTLN